MGLRARLTYDPDAIQLLKEKFVCVGQNLRQLGNPKGDDAQVRFWKSMKNQGYPTGNTFVVATPAGKVLYGGQYTDKLPEAWNTWKALPKNERRPDAVKVGPRFEGTPDPRWVPAKPPEAGLILSVYMRIMKRDAKGELARITLKDIQKDPAYAKWGPWPSWSLIYTEPMPDKMWITREEWTSLVPKNPKVGDRFEFPNPIRKRLIRYHLINTAYGNPLPAWNLKDVRSDKLTMRVEKTRPILRMRLEGCMLADDGRHGYDARIGGVLEYDRRKGAFTRFDIVAEGAWWGGDFEGGRFKRPDRSPFAVALELNTGNTPEDRVPPKGGRFTERALRYFRADEADPVR